jgi:hypothetical protein
LAKVIILSILFEPGPVKVNSLLRFSNTLFSGEEKRSARPRLPLRGFGQVSAHPFFFPGNYFAERNGLQLLREDKNNSLWAATVRLALR